MGALGSTGDDTRCLVDDQTSRLPQLVNCDKVSNLKQKTWTFSQVKGRVGRRRADEDVTYVKRCLCSRPSERRRREPGLGTMSGGGAG